MNFPYGLRSAVARSGVPVAALLLFCGLTGTPRAAEACGGCFHPENDPGGGSVVTDHRMVFEITAEQTILWDQVRYAGDPSEFAWVLPVRAGTRVELSRGEWIAALDAATQTTVRGPRPACPPKPATTSYSSSSGSSRSSSQSGYSSSSSGGGGCGGGSYSASNESAPSVGASSSGDLGSSGDSTPSFSSSEDVEVVAQSSIGPYQAVTLRAAGTTGVRDWLVTNGFVIPTSIAPVIDAYTAQKLDFIALRLRPGVGVRAMRPIRVVSPGADTTLPLRMVAAGIGAKVGLTLWVIGEGRYQAQNFPNAPVDWNSLAWDNTLRRSNRVELEAAALASNGGRSWITEAALRTSLTTSKLGAGLPNVFDAYTQQCQSRPRRTVACDETALPPPDGKPGDVPSDPDGGTDDGGALDDASTGTDGGTACTKVVSGCDGYDDLTVASRGLHPSDVWVTRLRADLPVSALATDLRLEGSRDQLELSPAHVTERFTDPTFDPCTGTSTTTTRPTSTPSTSRANDGADGCSCQTTPMKEGLGTWFLIGITAVALPFVTRRRRRRDGDPRS